MTTKTRHPALVGAHQDLVQARLKVLNGTQISVTMQKMRLRWLWRILRRRNPA